MSGEPAEPEILGVAAGSVNRESSMNIYYGERELKRGIIHILLHRPHPALFSPLPTSRLIIRMRFQNDDWCFPSLSSNMGFLQETSELGYVVSSELEAQLQSTSEQASCSEDWNTLPLAAALAYGHLSQVPQVPSEPPPGSSITQTIPDQQVVSLLGPRR